ncbi:MAG: polyprenyl synthetase family protein, partial [Chloroflexota bacterium]
MMILPGRACADPAQAKWPAMIWRLAHALSVPGELAQQAAVVTEFMIGALDVIDDVIDDESTAGNTGRAVNAGLALLSLAQAAGHELTGELPAAQGRLVWPCLTQALLVATAGEDLDILSESDSTVDESAALAMTERKSGALVAMAFELAGILHTSDPDMLSRLAEIGRQIGVLNQLDNDLQG